MNLLAKGRSGCGAKINSMAVINALAPNCIGQSKASAGLEGPSLHLYLASLLVVVHSNIVYPRRVLRI
jgi:hypothetical protein